MKVLGIIGFLLAIIIFIIIYGVIILYKYLDNKKPDKIEISYDNNRKTSQDSIDFLKGMSRRIEDMSKEEIDSLNIKIDKHVEENKDYLFPKKYSKGLRVIVKVRKNISMLKRRDEIK